MSRGLRLYEVTLPYGPKHLRRGTVYATSHGNAKCRAAKAAGLDFHAAWHARARLA